MTLVIYTAMKCDGCKTIYDPPRSTRSENVRKMATKAGWQVRLERRVAGHPQALLDYCPRCVDVGTQRETGEAFVPKESLR